VEPATHRFRYFVNNIFAASFPKHAPFVGGAFIDKSANFLQFNDKTMRVSARDHFKSTSLYAFIMWRLLLDVDRNVEGHYFSYNQDMAGYHLGKIKGLIASNPLFAGLIDLKPTADSILKYTWDKKHVFSVAPQGLLSFKRGIHGDDIYIDDALRDPANPLNTSQVEKVNNIIKTEVLDMGRRFFHIVGTAMTEFDFYWDTGLKKHFSVRVLPAIQNHAAKEVLWPEGRPWEWLQQKLDEKKERIFNQEFMCSPVWTEQAYLDKKKLYDCINPSAKNLDIFTDIQKIYYPPGAPIKLEKDRANEERIAGIDIGLKAHPSHLVVFAKRRLLDASGNWMGKRDERTGEVEYLYRHVQLLSAWFDYWPYTNGKNEYDTDNPTQLEYIKLVLKNWKLDYIYYDATRGEWEGFKQQGLIDWRFKGIIFTTKEKTELAENLDKLITQKEVEFIPDERQLRQMLMVNNELKALESPEGHADSFWSNAMALNGFPKSQSIKTFPTKAKGF